MKKSILCLITMLLILSLAISCKPNDNGDFRANIAIGSATIPLAAGENFVLRLTSDGSLFVRPSDASESGYQLFPGTEFMAIDANNERAAAINKFGKLYYWENASYTNLADFVTYPLDDKVIDVSIGDSHIGVVTSDGSIFMWGNNHYNQLGLKADKIEQDYSTPMKLTQAEGLVFEEIECGTASTIAKTKSGELYEWGYFDTPITDPYAQNGHIGVPMAINFSEDIRIADMKSGFFFDVLLTSDGDLYSRGRNDYYQCQPSEDVYISDFTKIDLSEPIKQFSVGTNHVIALDSTGDVYAWGGNGHGQLSLPISMAEKPQKIAIDEKVNTVVALGACSIFVSDNVLLTTGLNADTILGIDPKELQVQPLIISSIQTPFTEPKFVHISSGYSMSAAIDTEKKVYVWGSSWNGCLGNESIKDIALPQLLPFPAPCKQLDTTYGITTVLLENGDIYNFGSNVGFRLGLGHTMNMWKPAKVNLPGPVTKFFTGPNATIALLETGEWYAWGDNSYGSLLTGDLMPHTSPVKLDIPYDVSKMVSHVTYSLILDKNGNVYKFGDFAFGTDRNMDKLFFEPINFNTTVVDIAASYSGVYVVTKQGSVFTWGDNSDGMIGLADKKIYTEPTEISLDVPIKQIVSSPIFGEILALSTNGKVYTWGYDVLRKGKDEVLSRPVIVALPENVMEVVVGDLTAYAVLKTGDIFTWGGVINNAQREPQRIPIAMKNKFAL